VRVLTGVKIPIILVGLLAVCLHMSCANTDESVAFPDSNLEAAVRRAIDKPTGSISKFDLEGLTELGDNGSGIIDLTGLEYCVNLTTLNITRNQVSDISPLSKP